MNQRKESYLFVNKFNTSVIMKHKLECKWEGGISIDWNGFPFDCKRMIGVSIDNGGILSSRRILQIDLPDRKMYKIIKVWSKKSLISLTISVAIIRAKAAITWNTRGHGEHSVWTNPDITLAMIVEKKRKLSVTRKANTDR